MDQHPRRSLVRSLHRALLAHRLDLPLLDLTPKVHLVMEGVVEGKLITMSKINKDSKFLRLTS